MPNKINQQDRIEEVRISKDLYWQIKSMLRGMQMRQKANPHITWGTSLDAVLEKLNKLELFPQPLTDEELREKMEQQTAERLRVYFGSTYSNDEYLAVAKSLVGQDFALLQPKIEEEREKIKLMITEVLSGIGRGSGRVSKANMQALKGGK